MRPSTTGNQWVVAEVPPDSLALSFSFSKCPKISKRCLFGQMHFLLYGTGMQTWEYSPLYAIRSYAYLWLHALPACLHAHVLQTNKVTLWTSCRVLCQLIFLILNLIFFLKHKWFLVTTFDDQLCDHVQQIIFINFFLTAHTLQRLQFGLFFVITVLQVLVFYFVRCVLAFSCCVCELYFYKWVLTTPHFGSHAGGSGHASLSYSLAVPTALLCVFDTGRCARSLVCMSAAWCWRSSSWALECSALLLVGHILTLVWSALCCPS